MERIPIKYPRKSEPDIEQPYGYIYIITNTINQRRYIGQKSSPILVEDYWGSSEILNKAISKYGLSNFTREILDWASSKFELNRKEVYWIDEIDTYHGVGYNCSVGGEGLGHGEDHPCYGRHYNLGENNAFYGKGLKHTDKSRRKMSLAKQNSFGEKNNFYGHHHTEEWKEQYRNGSNNPMAKPVYQYSLSGKFIKSYAFLKEVEKYGFSNGIVGNRCLLKVHDFINQRKPYKGFLWSYLPPIDNHIPPLEDEPKYKKS